MDSRLRGESAPQYTPQYTPRIEKTCSGVLD